MSDFFLGFNGERIDPVSGVTHLGHGYRAYNPVLMRFSCPDSWSLFDCGGINPYTYCAGDPLNRADSSGHMSWRTGLNIGLSFLGFLGTVFTGGGSIVAAGSITVALAGVSTLSLVVGASGLVADVAGIASGAVEKGDQKRASVLGWISFAAGILSLGTGLVASGYRLGYRAINKISLFKSERITWGNVDDIDNVQALGIGKSYSPLRIKDTYYSFDDLKKGDRRLNIVAHGRFDAGLGYATVGFDNVSGRYTGKCFAIYLKDMGIDFSEYSGGGARLIIFFSGDGIESFASQFARESGLKIKAFSGFITTEGELQSMVNAHSSPHSVAEIYGGDLSVAEEILNVTLIDTFPRNKLFNIIKDNRGIPGGYNPVKVISQ